MGLLGIKAGLSICKANALPQYYLSSSSFIYILILLVMSIGFKCILSFESLKPFLYLSRLIYNYCLVFGVEVILLMLKFEHTFDHFSDTMSCIFLSSNVLNILSSYALNLLFLPPTAFFQTSLVHKYLVLNLYSCTFFFFSFLFLHS